MSELETQKRDDSLHFDRQRESVLQAAERLFVLRGIEITSITDIAYEAGLTRTTVYRYFANKQDIAWELLKVYFGQLRDASQIEQWNDNKTGYERVEAFIASLFTYFWENLDRARFMAQFDQVYSAKWKPEPMLGLLQEVLGERQRFLVQAIELGMADGSLRADLNAELSAVTIINLIASLERRLAAMPTHVEAEYGQKVKDIYIEADRMILHGIRSQGKLGIE